MFSQLQIKKYEKLKKGIIFSLLVFVVFTSINISFFFDTKISYGYEKPVIYVGNAAIDSANQAHELNQKLSEQGLITASAVKCRGLGGVLDVLKNAECWPPLMLKSVSEPIYYASTWLLELSGLVLDKAIEFTMESKNYNADPIKAGWKIVRDLVNMVFIFILLYIAFKTILQLSGFDTKKLLVKLILVAIFLNFSFFLTAFVIDTGNILGKFFYTAATPIALQVDEDAGSINAPRINQPTPLSYSLARNLNVPTILKSSEPGTGSENQPTLYQESIMIILGAFAIFVAAISFISVGIMFIARTVSLIFILVLAPAAFVAMILPKTEKFWSNWLGRLMSNTFILPVYTFLILLVIIITNNNAVCNAMNVSGTDCSGQSLLGALNVGGEPLENVAILITYMLIIGFILFAQKAAKSMGDNISTATAKWAKGAVGVGAVGAGLGLRAGAATGGFLGRRGFGWASKKLSENEKVKEWTSKHEKYGGQKAMQLLKYGAKASYDIRGGKVGKAIDATAGAALRKAKVKVKVGKAQGQGGFQRVVDRKAERDYKYGEHMGKAGYSKEEAKDLRELNLKKTEAIESKDTLAALYHDSQIKEIEKTAKKRAETRKRKTSDFLDKATVLSRTFGLTAQRRETSAKLRLDVTDLDKLLKGLLDKQKDVQQDQQQYQQPPPAQQPSND